MDRRAAFAITASYEAWMRGLRIRFIHSRVSCRWRIRSQAATGISNRPRCVAIGERLGVRAGSVPGGLNHEYRLAPRVGVIE